MKISNNHSILSRKLLFQRVFLSILEDERSMIAAGRFKDIASMSERKDRIIRRIDRYDQKYHLELAALYAASTDSPYTELLDSLTTVVRRSIDVEHENQV
jgi:flagellar biosynthesis/type III secretory pathway chaperone